MKTQMSISFTDFYMKGVGDVESAQKRMSFCKRIPHNSELKPVIIAGKSYDVLVNAIGRGSSGKVTNVF